MYSIYLITNKVNGKIYIGQTCETLHRRWSRHCNQAGDGTHFHKAIALYGKDSFMVRELSSCETKEESNNFERLWISVLEANNHDKGYNSTLGGESNKGYKRSREAIEKSSAANRGSKRTPETKNRMSEWQIGKKLADEHKEKISAGLKRAYSLGKRGKSSGTNYS